MAKIESGVSASDILTIDPISKAARAALYDPNGVTMGFVDQAQPANPSGIALMGQNDKSMMLARMDRWGSLASALHTPVFSESFEGATINANRWNITNTTMAATQSSVNGLVINSGSIVTASTGYLLSSAKRIMITQRSPLQAKFRVKLAHVNNCLMEFGLSDVSAIGGTATAGFYWQVTASGVIQPVVTFNGVDQTGSDIRSLLDISKFYTFDVMKDDDEAIFIVQDTSTGNILSRQSIKLPTTGVRLLSATSLPVMMRLFNSASAPATAPQMIISDVYVAALDADQNKPWAHLMAAMERGATAQPFTGLQYATWTNSAEPASATLSNTAAGYSTLGGKFQFAAVAGAATDYCLFGFQIPAPANFHITGIDIETWNTGAAVATTPTLLTWGVAVGATAVTLANTNANRVGLGAQSFPVGAAVGAKAERISKSFQTPLHCPAGRFVQIILRMPVGTATASEIFAGMVNIEGYCD